MDYRKLLRTLEGNLLKEFPGFTRQELRNFKKRIPVKEVKILSWDIETSQMITKVWQLMGNDYIEPTRIQEDWFIVCWSAKSLNGKMYHDRLTSKEAKVGDDKRIVLSLWKLLNEQDYLVAHNGDNFDLKKAQTRFLKYGLPNPNYFKTIDTLKVAKRYFRISSNKLDYVCKFVGLEGKVQTGGVSLWDSCELGDEKALRKMSHYCDNDVKILEQLFLKLLPYIKNLPLLL
jgi:DNA polymerase elongation subunit (family B)